MKAYTQEFQKNISPKEVLKILKEGNKRFVENNTIDRNLLDQVHQTANQGQFPIAIFLSCIDARTSITHIFNLGIGDAFSVKIAGNVVNQDVLGSLEYACKVAGSKLIVVKGHSMCGAVTAACQNKHFDNITPLVNKIKKSIEKIELKNFNYQNQKDDFVNSVAKENVLKSIEEIRKGSKILSDMEKNKEI